MPSGIGECLQKERGPFQLCFYRRSALRILPGNLSARRSGGRVSIICASWLPLAEVPSIEQVLLGISQGRDVTDSPRCSTCIGAGRRAGEDNPTSVFAEKEIIEPMERMHRG